MAEQLEEKQVSSMSFEDHPPMTPPAAPRPPRKMRGSIAGAIFLIGLGALLLLDNLNMISINWWGLLAFWPAGLILVGLDLALKRTATGRLISSVLSLAVVAAVIYFGGILGAADALPGANAIEGDFSERLGSADSLNASVDIGIAETHITTLSGGDDAVQGSYLTDRRFGVTVNYDEATGDLEIAQQDNDESNFFPTTSNSRLNVALNGDVPVTLAVNGGIGRAVLDLTGMLLESLDVDAGLGEVEITLPESGHFSVTVSAGIGQITLIIPRSLEARINVDQGLSGFSVPDRFEEVGDSLWESLDFDSAENQAEISLDAGIGNISIRDK